MALTQPLTARPLPASASGPQGGATAQGEPPALPSACPAAHGSFKEQKGLKVTRSQSRKVRQEARPSTGVTHSSRSAETHQGCSWPGGPGWLWLPQRGLHP